MKKNVTVLLLLVVSLYAARSLLTERFVPTHDGEYHIVRFWQFDRMIREGFLFPRWAPDLNNGFGVPLFQYFYPLPNYIGEIFHKLGFSFVTSLHLVLASGLVLSSVTFYLWMRCFFDKQSSFVASVMYLLAPYHLVDVFVRGSVGEVWALAIGPLVLFAVSRVIQEKTGRQLYYVLLSISSALLLLAHTVVGVMFFVFSVVYACLLWWKQKKSTKRIVLAGLGYLSGILLTSFFFIPVVFEQEFVRGLDIVNYRDHFPDLFQLIFPSWGSGFSVPGVTDQISFQIGIVHLVAITVLLLLLVKQLKQISYITFFILFTSIVSVVFMLDVSLPVWDMFPFLRFFQYPWRILSLVILSSSYMIGYVLDKKKWYVAFISLCFGFFLYLPYTNAITYEKREDSYYLGNPNWTDGTATLGNSFNTKWYIEQEPANRLFSLQTDSSVQENMINSVRFEATVQSDSTTNLTIHKAYFPGWSAVVNRKKVTIDKTEHGLMQIRLPEGSHSILISYENTPARTVGTYLTLLSIVAIATIVRLNYLWK